MEVAIMNKTKNTISYNEICQIAGLSEDNVFEIVEYEIVMPLAGNNITQWIFDIASIHWIKRAVRLREDFQIDWIAVALLIDLLKEKEILRCENAALQRKLNRLMQTDIL